MNTAQESRTCLRPGSVQSWGPWTFPTTQHHTGKEFRTKYSKISGLQCVSVRVIRFLWGAPEDLKDRAIWRKINRGVKIWNKKKKKEQDLLSSSDWPLLWTSWSVRPTLLWGSRWGPWLLFGLEGPSASQTWEPRRRPSYRCPCGPWPLCPSHLKWLEWSEGGERRIRHQTLTLLQ